MSNEHSILLNKWEECKYLPMVCRQANIQMQTRIQAKRPCLARYFTIRTKVVHICGECTYTGNIIYRLSRLCYVPIRLGLIRARIFKLLRSQSAKASIRRFHGIEHYNLFVAMVQVTRTNSVL
jgi:hypothetical protein